MSESSFGQVGRNTALYTLGSLIQRAVGFAMLPVYTRYLTKEDYGVMQLLDITVDVAAILFFAGMTAGVQRYFFSAESDAERLRTISTGYLLEMLLVIVAAVALFAAAPLAPLIGLREPEHVVFVRITALNFTLSLLTSVPLLFLQIEKRAGMFFVATMTKLALQVTLNLTFVAGFGLGVLGILYSSFVANAIVGLSLAVWLLRRTGMRFSWPIARQLRSFGIPYQITTAGTFILAFGDRFFLAQSRTIGEVGIYGLAYQFGFLLAGLVEVPFLRAWNPMRFQQVALPRHERDASYGQGLDMLSVALAMVATGIVLFAGPVIRLATTAEFHAAAALVPLIIASYVMQCYASMSTFGIDVSTRTKYVGYATWVSVVVVFVLYATLIPRYGGLGAAWATFIAFSVRFGLMYFFAQRLWPVSYSWGVTVRAMAIGVTTLAVRGLLSVTSLRAELLTSALLAATCAVMMWALALRDHERTSLTAWVRRTLLAVRGAAG